MSAASTIGQSQYDRASLAQRQAGSSFKPFVYLTAMEAGHTPHEMVVDEPLTIGNWTPHNYTGKYLGPITLETALAQSINTVAARLANEVGTDNVAATAHRLGITTPIQTDPVDGAGRGRGDARWRWPRPMPPSPTAAIGPRPTASSASAPRRGQVLYDHDLGRAPRAQVIGQPALAYMIQMMRQVIAVGTGARAEIAGYDLAGKTGTTSDYRDAWFIGFTGGFTAAVWVGRDDNTPMRKVTGGGSAGGDLARLHGRGPAPAERPAHPRRPPRRSLGRCDRRHPLRGIQSAGRAARRPCRRRRPPARRRLSPSRRRGSRRTEPIAARRLWSGRRALRPAHQAASEPFGTPSAEGSLATGARGKALFRSTAELIWCKAGRRRPCD